jgi:hypothetical protein
LRSASDGTDVDPDTLQPTFTQFTFTGDLCPQGSYNTQVTSNGSVVATSFGSETTAASSTCSIVFDMDMPSGYQMANPILMLQSWGLTASLSRSYTYDGASDMRQYNDDIVDSMTLVDPFDVWSSSCDGSSHVRLVATLQATVQPDGLFELDELDLNTAHRSGVDWRRCGDASPLQSPPGMAGDYCAGPHNRPCAQGLTCELDGVVMTAGAEGRCVDPNQQLPPSAKGDICGGVRHIACQDGLECWWGSQASADSGNLGRCFPAVGGAGDICEEGVPAPTCAAGLTCKHPAPGASGDNTCVAAS